MTTIFLVTGWGIGVKSLSPLQKQLENKGYRVLVHDLPYAFKSDEWLEVLAKKLPPQSYWVGYSLGGQLLCALTLTHAERCLGLMTLASNVSFKVAANWHYAMPVDTFNSFKNSYQQAPEKTLKRFFQLVAKGDKQAKEIVIALSQETEGAIGYYERGLSLLDSLNNKEALQAFTKPQCHLFAAQDALVPLFCANALQALVPKALITTFAEGGHGFPISQAPSVASVIDQFIKGGSDVA